MSKTITNRDDFFLAKVAGRDIDIGSLTPGVPSNAREELLLEIADRIDEGGGGGGSDALYVPLTFLENYGNTRRYTSTVTPETIVEQYQSRIPVYLYDDSAAAPQYIPVVTARKITGGYEIFAELINETSPSVKSTIIKSIAYDSSHNYYTEDFVAIRSMSGQELPEATSFPDGQVLSTVNGSWSHKTFRGTVQVTVMCTSLPESGSSATAYLTNDGKKIVKDAFTYFARNEQNDLIMSVDSQDLVVVLYNTSGSPRRYILPFVVRHAYNYALFSAVILGDQFTDPTTHTPFIVSVEVNTYEGTATVYVRNLS